ncbi:hypothetical protein HK101_001030 [Irineochytrium annulatum]|nr:hypothetical protein HK101_001030 [Irineochytrium annulatum]
MSHFEVDVAGVNDLKDGEMKEIALGDGQGKVLLSKIQGAYHATSHLCPHYKAPLVKGVLSADGRVMCPWHGACFRVQSGDIEDGPSVDSLVKHLVTIKGGRVFVKVNPEEVKAAKRVPTCTKKSPAAPKTVVILGGGAAGLVASETLRSEGFTGKVILLSREPYVPIDRPKLSKALKIDPAKIAVRDADHFKKLDIDIRLGVTVTGCDTNSKKVTLASGESVSFDKLIVATGGDPRTLPVPGKELQNVFVLRTALDSNGIDAALAELAAAGVEKPNVVIVGSSFIGMEAAAILAKTAKVTVIGMEKVPFVRVLGEKVGEAMGQLNKNNGVTLKMEAMLDRFEPNAKNPKKIGAAVLKTGEKIPADVIIIGAGVIPKTDYLKSTGITLDRDQGITVEATMKVPNFPDVYVVGDIARYPYHLTGESVRVEHWNVAQNQGRLAAKNILLELAGKTADLKFTQVPYFWTVQYGKSIRYSGHAESFDDVVIHGSLDPENLAFVAYYGRAGKVLAVASVAKDPAVSHASELLRVGKMPSMSELKAGIDVLTVKLSGDEDYLAAHKPAASPSSSSSTVLVLVGVLVALAAVAYAVMM